MTELFKEYSPVEDKIFQVIDNHGKVINKKWMPELTDEVVLKAYKDMLFARTADLMAVSYQRQGRMYTYPPNLGQEAIAGGVALVMREEDWLAPAFRELGMWLAKGVPMRDVFLYFMGNEHAAAFKTAKNSLPISVPIATQLIHATGIGYAIKYKKEDKVVFAVIGDGGTSEGDFHEALNFAGAWKVPVIFIVQNNQYAISVPFRVQTASINIAVKSIAYGMPGIKVDGNDIFAVYQAMKAAHDFAREGNGPVLIECLTYRKGAHTTSDDPTKYRTHDEEEVWGKTDPLDRLKLYLLSKKLWKEEDEVKLIGQYKKEIDKQFEEAENFGEYSEDDVFDYTYVDMPEDLKNQKMEYKKFLSWKEAQK
jgi:pyruvate dehydrogenase E1 component alpha subunit